MHVLGNNGLNAAKGFLRHSERDIYMKWMDLKLKLGKPLNLMRRWSPFEDALIFEGRSKEKSWQQISN